MGDILRLTQVSNNLVSNGVKFTPMGGSVVVTYSYLDNQTLLLTVADSGIGHSYRLSAVLHVACHTLG
jgi:signal transduction histidine kinase